MTGSTLYPQTEHVLCVDTWARVPFVCPGEGLSRVTGSEPAIGGSCYPIFGTRGDNPTVVEYDLHLVFDVFMFKAGCRNRH